MAVLIFVWLIFLVLPGASPAQTAELVLGNPSEAGASDPDNQLVVRKGFILSYNRSRGSPNWVAWHLSKRDLGRFNREAGSFRIDDLLPPDSQVKESVYKGSRYELGHMCPSKDRSNRKAANRATFIMSNVSPQVKRLNAGVWRVLEKYTQTMATLGWEAYIYAGCYGTTSRIAGQVTVPTRCFKVILFLPDGNNDLQRIDENTRVVAVDMANGIDLKRPWRENRTTIAEIEEQTGLKFLTTLSPPIQAALKSSLDDQ